MLFLDGHGSHLNLTFLEWCLQHKILVACYPPHSTHRLQPLDVGCFAPLASYYSQGLDCHLAAFNELRQRLISRRRRTLTALLEVALEKLRLSLQLSNVVWRLCHRPLCLRERRSWRWCPEMSVQPTQHPIPIWRNDPNGCEAARSNLSAEGLSSSLLVQRQELGFIDVVDAETHLLLDESAVHAFEH